MQQKRSRINNKVEHHFRDQLSVKITDRVGTLLREQMWKWQSDQWIRNQYPIISQITAQLRTDMRPLTKP